EHHSSICSLGIAVGLSTPINPNKQNLVSGYLCFINLAASTNSPMPLSHNIRAINKKETSGTIGFLLKRFKSIPSPGNSCTFVPFTIFFETKVSLSSLFRNHTSLALTKAILYKHLAIYDIRL